MKLYNDIASRVKAKLPNNVIARKLISTTVATVVLTAGAFVYSSRPSARSIDAPETSQAQLIVEEPVAPTAPRGLSRQRADFEKAINILASGAAGDKQMAEYYRRVQKRVRGEALVHENGSGVRVVKSSRKSGPPTKAVRQDAAELASATQRQKDSKSILEAIKGFVFDGMVADNKPAAKSEPEAVATEQAAAISSPDEDADTGLVRQSAASKLIVGDMSFETNPAIERWVNYYTTSQVGQRTMSIGLKRSSAYLDMARVEFRRAGVPEDLVWLALVESVWNPAAKSPAAAGGIWQFIPKTATEYGLEVTSANDERTDPLKQTRVAATYLRDLYTIFGDWALAMAAYNTGEPRVMEAVVKNGRANFWELYDKQLIPKETRDYVPKILAAIQVAGQAESSDFESGLDSQTLTGGR